uniref:Kallikrein related peptidase 8 n=2 Tax=Ornithorhynchus anatinus TaxID=9258 RepID=A0A6I8N009_ORNAN
PSRQQDTKVLGGEECRPHSQPWQVAFFEDSRLLCGGVLIHPAWVLTAAHCQKRKVSVLLGKHNLEEREGPEQSRQVALSVPHPCYRPDGGAHGGHRHDLMLVKLRSPAVLSTGVRPVPLPGRCPRPDDTCLVSGWGTTSSLGESFPDTLNCAELNVLPQNRCEVAYPGQMTDSMLCAGDSGGTDTCQGDSGGPLVCNGTLAGITSWGSNPCGEPERPGVYTSVCRYLDWIKGIVGV